MPQVHSLAVAAMRVSLAVAAAKRSGRHSEQQRSGRLLGAGAGLEQLGVLSFLLKGSLALVLRAQEIVATGDNMSLALPLQLGTGAGL